MDTNLMQRNRKVLMELGISPLTIKCIGKFLIGYSFIIFFIFYKNTPQSSRSSSMAMFQSWICKDVPGNTIKHLNTTLSSIWTQNYQASEHKTVKHLNSTLSSIWTQRYQASEPSEHNTYIGEGQLQDFLLAWNKIFLFKLKVLLLYYL